MRLHITAALVCSSALATHSVAESQDNARLVEEVRCVELAFAYSVERGDRAAFAGFLANDARFVGAQLLRGPEEILKAWEPFLDTQYPRLVWRPATVEILADGGLALSRGPYLLTTRDAEGSLVEQWGYYNSVWRRDGEGRWKIQVDMGQSHAGEMPPEDRARLDTPLTELLNPCGSYRP